MPGNGGAEAGASVFGGEFNPDPCIRPEHSPLERRDGQINH